MRQRTYSIMKRSTQNQKRSAGLPEFRRTIPCGHGAICQAAQDQGQDETRRVLPAKYVVWMRYRCAARSEQFSVSLNYRCVLKDLCLQDAMTSIPQYPVLTLSGVVN